jgi:DNA-binding XRE family transcriptional regulator
MEIDNIKNIRARLNKTQKELAQLLGVSIKAVHSYEQGWRRIPHHVERQLLFLLSRSINNGKPLKNCWEIIHKCPANRQKTCPAIEFNAGDICWFINGTQCSGKIHKTWEDKIQECYNCKVFKTFFKLAEEDL